MKRVEVAAAVIERPDGQFLLGRRPPEGIYAGWWEFPGGKVEAGETPHAALVRELQEELGITVTASQPWITREHVYSHAHVRLHFFRVTAWEGEIRDLQHDLLSWQLPHEVTVAPVLPANAPVFAGLRLPTVYAITHAAELGVTTQLERLESALRNGMNFLQIREPSLEPSVRSRFVHEAVKLCREHDARVLVNGDIELARQVRADGVHLPARQLAALDKRPGFALVGASCHDRQELAQAAALALDFVTVGTVLPSQSHPGQPALGWDRFATLIEGYALPVFAIGGLAQSMLSEAKQHGAHGIAAIRGVWSA